MLGWKVSGWSGTRLSWGSGGRARPRRSGLPARRPFRAGSRWGRCATRGEDLRKFRLSVAIGTRQVTARIGGWSWSPDRAVVPPGEGPCRADEPADGDDGVGEVEERLDDVLVAFVAALEPVEGVVPGVCPFAGASTRPGGMPRP